MKKDVGPALIVVAVVLIVGFIFYMYKITQPDLQAAPDPRNGPPGYAKKGGGGGSMPGVSSAPQVPGQAPGGKPK